MSAAKEAAERIPNGHPALIAAYNNHHSQSDYVTADEQIQHDAKSIIRAYAPKLKEIRGRMQDIINVMDTSTSAAAEIWKEVEAAIDELMKE